MKCGECARCKHRRNLNPFGLQTVNLLARKRAPLLRVPLVLPTPPKEAKPSPVVRMQIVEKVEPQGAKDAAKGAKVEPQGAKDVKVEPQCAKEAAKDVKVEPQCAKEAAKDAKVEPQGAKEAAKGAKEAAKGAKVEPRGAKEVEREAAKESRLDLKHAAKKESGLELKHAAKKEDVPLGSGALTKVGALLGKGEDEKFEAWIAGQSFSWDKSGWERLQNSEFWSLECGGGGDCLFYCVAKGLNMYTELFGKIQGETFPHCNVKFDARDKEISMWQVREAAAATLNEQNVKDFSLEYFNSSKNNCDLARLKEQIAKPGTLLEGDTSVLHHLLLTSPMCLEKMLGFVVLSLDSKHRLVCQPFCLASTEFVLLLFCNGSHWTLLATKCPKLLPLHHVKHLPAPLHALF